LRKRHWSWGNGSCIYIYIFFVNGGSGGVVVTIVADAAADVTTAVVVECGEEMMVGWVDLFFSHTKFWPKQKT
jgi:hypothetical protein